MFRFDRVIKPWKESASLNDHLNLYGFWNEHTFLTKSGDLGMVLSVAGVDYESLDHAEQEYAVKRLEAALKHFGPGFHVYQYLFKRNRPEVPFASYDDPIVSAAVEQRRQFFELKRDDLYHVEIFYAIVLEGTRSKTGVAAALGRLAHDPAGAVAELRAQFTNNSMKTLLRSPHMPKTSTSRLSATPAAGRRPSSCNSCARFRRAATRLSFTILPANSSSGFTMPPAVILSSIPWTAAALTGVHLKN